MLDFLRQFYAKQTWWVLGGVFLAHLAAASVLHSAWSWVPLVVIALAVGGVSYYKLEWGLALAFLELFIGGHGHLFEVALGGFSLSVREVIFLAVMTAWGVLVVTKHSQPSFVTHRDLPLALIGVAVVIATLKGLVANDPRTTFDDMNGFFTLAYVLPVISLRWDGVRRRLLLQTLAVAAIWIAVSTLAYVYLFTHLPGLASHQLYTFVRDTRLAEITLLTSGAGIELLGNSPWYFRVFQQSQVIVAAFEMLLIAGTLLIWKDSHERLPSFVGGLHALMISAIVASLSRSMWIGCLAGMIVVLAFVVSTRPQLISLLKRQLQFGLFTLVALFTLYVLIVIPVPPRPDLSDSSFYKGRDDNTREVAVSSRWNLLTPMLKEIGSDPIIGSGFGETVTYISDDPRLRAVNPTGEVTTYRFEWGYHDLWLKMGILGLLAFGWFYVTTIMVAVETVARGDKRYWIVVGLSAGLTMIYVTHIFSPYLNHPIGLGFMVFLLPFLPWEEHELTYDESEEHIHLSLPKVKPTVGIAFTQK